MDSGGGESVEEVGNEVLSLPGFADVLRGGCFGSEADAAFAVDAVEDDAWDVVLGSHEAVGLAASGDDGVGNEEGLWADDVLGSIVKEHVDPVAGVGGFLDGVGQGGGEVGKFLEGAVVGSSRVKEHRLVSSVGSSG